MPQKTLSKDIKKEIEKQFEIVYSKLNEIYDSNTKKLILSENLSKNMHSINKVLLDLYKQASNFPDEQIKDKLSKLDIYIGEIGKNTNTADAVHLNEESYVKYDANKEPTNPQVAKELFSKNSEILKALERVEAQKREFKPNTSNDMAANALDRINELLKQAANKRAQKTDYNEQKETNKQAVDVQNKVAEKRRFDKKKNVNTTEQSESIVLKNLSRELETDKERSKKKQKQEKPVSVWRSTLKAAIGIAISSTLLFLALPLVNLITATSSSLSSLIVPIYLSTFFFTPMIIGLLAYVHYDKHKRIATEMEKDQKQSQVSTDSTASHKNSSFSKLILTAKTAISLAVATTLPLLVPSNLLKPLGLLSLGIISSPLAVAYFLMSTAYVSVVGLTAYLNYKKHKEASIIKNLTASLISTETRSHLSGKKLAIIGAGATSVIAFLLFSSPADVASAISLGVLLVEMYIALFVLTIAVEITSMVLEKIDSYIPFKDAGLGNSSGSIDEHEMPAPIRDIEYSQHRNDIH